MKSTVKDWLKVMALLLDEVVVLVIVLLALWYFEVEIPLTAVVIGGLALVALIFFTHRAIMPVLHKKKITGRESMIGQSGQVTETLCPKGTVRIENETWQAVTEGADIKAGEEVEIVGLNGLTLTVKPKEE